MARNSSKNIFWNVEDWDLMYSILFLPLFIITSANPEPAIYSSIIAEPISPERAENFIETGICRACYFLRMDFSGMIFEEANLDSALIEVSDFSESSLQDASFVYAHITSSNFSRSILRFSNMHKIIIRRTKLNDTDMSNTNITEASITSLDASNLKLKNSQIVDTDIESVDLSNASFEGANLEGSTLRKVILFGADLQETNLESVIFNGILYDESTRFPDNFEVTTGDFYWIGPHANVSNLESGYRRVKLVGRDLERINFSQSSILLDASFSNLQGANFKEANLRLGIFRESNLENASFCDADLTNVNFQGSNMSNSNLQNALLYTANLNGSNLRNANLLNTDFSYARLDDVDLQDAIYNSQTQFPEYFDPIAAGAIFSEESLDNCLTPSSN
jgi:uncharacterized protein YjbI with pentapeptide repeats